MTTIAQLQSSATAIDGTIDSVSVITSTEAERKRWQLRVRVLWSCPQWLTHLKKGLIWLQQKSYAQLAAKRLRVCETTSLGEKRFVAIVQVDGRQFLVGGGQSGVSLLAALDSVESFPELFNQQLRKGQVGR